MSDLEYDVIDELYFVTAYQTIFNNVGFDENDLKSTLTSLLNDGLIDQFYLSEETNEFEKCTTVDFSHLEQYSYLANKKGLLLHNGIG